MNCPNCGASMQLDGGKTFLSCPYCRHIHHPQPDRDGVRLLDKEAETNCPVCSKPLLHAAVSEVPLLSCGACRGLLMAMHVFVVLVAQLRAARDASHEAPGSPSGARDLARVLQCPKCRRKMHTHFYAGPGNVVIDNCPACKLNWLDHSELQKIVTAPDQRPRAPLPYSGKFAHEMTRKRRPKAARGWSIWFG